MKTKEEITLTVHTILAQSYQIRTETHQGKQHIVVPVIMMVEGVHAGSRGPLLHLASELGKVVDSWNGIPITIDHPQQQGAYISANNPEIIDNCVGRVYNTYIDGDKLKAEAWLDVEKLKAVSPEASAYIMQQKPLDVSVGVFSDEQEEQGEWNGESYIAIAHNHRPDHLALLPGGRGACSWADGCGIRVNTNFKSKANGMKTEELFKVYKDLNKAGFAVSPVVNETGYMELMQSMSAKFDSMDSGATYYYMEELYDDKVIYRRRNSEFPGNNALFQQSYEVDEAKKINFVGDPVEVKKETSYLPISTNSFKRTKFNNKSDTTMNVNKKVEELVANSNGRFVDCDKQWLSNLTDEQLDKIKPQTVVKTEKQELDVNTALKFLKENETKTEDVLELLSKEAKEAYDKGIKLHNDKLKELKDIILANSKVWAQEELDAMEFDMLDKLSKSVKPAADYSGMDAGGDNPVVNAQEQEDEDFLPIMQTV